VRGLQKQRNLKTYMPVPGAFVSFSILPVISTYIVGLYLGAVLKITHDVCVGPLGATECLPRFGPRQDRQRRDATNGAGLSPNPISRPAWFCAVNRRACWSEHPAFLIIINREERRSERRRISENSCAAPLVQSKNRATSSPEVGFPGAPLLRMSKNIARFA
jgi:hypothetical protein